MANSTKKLSFQKLAGPVRSSVFFVLFFLYLWLKVDLRFIYHSGGVVKNFPAFYLDWMFFLGHLSYPGGPVKYITAFLAQLWYIGWAGALIATLAAWLVFVCTDTIIKVVKAPRLRFVRFIGPILLLAIYTRYTYHFDTAVSLLAGLVFVILYLKITQKHERFSLIILLALSAILYYLGGKSYSLFAVICWIYEWLFNRRGKTGLLYLLLAIAVPYVAEGLILDTGAHDTFIRHLPLPFSSETRMLIVAYVLYFLVPLTVLGLGFCRTIGAQLYPNIKSRINTSRPAMVILSEVIKTMVLFVIASLSIFLAYDSRTVMLKADYYACQGKWPDVIRVARSYPNSLISLHMVNRALYHTGRLGYDMFTFPQNSSALFLDPKEFVGQGDISYRSVRALWHRFGTYLDLGCINRAQYELYSILEVFGERPVLLKNLAMINMVKGNYNSARVYLNALSKTLFHADWANKYMEKLKTDSTLERDEEVQQLRSMMLVQNCGFTKYKADRISLDLLEANRQNHMAFEYLMAYYLLERRPGLEPFVQNLYRLKDFDYPKIPRLYEEAILVYMYETRKTVDLQGFRIGPESIRRHNNFARAIQSHGGNLKAAHDNLTKDYGDSYMFYYLYGHSGAGK